MPTFWKPEEEAQRKKMDKEWEEEFVQKINNGRLFRQEKHPEQADDEIFLHNCDERFYEKIDWKTKRKGQVAYDRDGNNPSRHYFPVFVKKSEANKRKK